MFPPDAAPSVVSAARTVDFPWWRRSPLWLCRRRCVTRSFGAGRRSFHEAVAAAIAGHAQQIRLKFLVDAQTQDVILDGRIGFDLPPFTVFAQTPFSCHDPPSF